LKSELRTKTSLFCPQGTAAVFPRLCFVGVTIYELLADRRESSRRVGTPESLKSTTESRKQVFINLAYGYL
jgi:hypothetical protein